MTQYTKNTLNDKWKSKDTTVFRTMNYENTKSDFFAQPTENNGQSPQ